MKSSGADGVFLGGYIVSNSGRLIRDLRQALGSGVSLMATEGMLPITALRARAGDAAEGLLITLSSIPKEHLEGHGADFLAAFRKATGQDPCCYTVHVAQAADAALGAAAGVGLVLIGIGGALTTIRIRRRPVGVRSS